MLITPLAPTTLRHLVTAIPLVTIGLTPQAPATTSGILADIPVETISITPFAPVTLRELISSIPLATISVSPQAPAIIRDLITTVPVEIISLTPFAPTTTVIQELISSIPLATIALTPQAITSAGEVADTVAGLPQFGVAYDLEPQALQAVGVSKKFLTDPTIVAGDFTIQKDFGAYANLENLPIVTPAGSRSVRIRLTATEMAASKIAILGSDQVGDEWQEIFISIDVPTVNADDIYDLAVGDKEETKTSQKIFLKDTTIELLSKDVSGSLLADGVTIKTTEP